jgi:hypothetical protein
MHPSSGVAAVQPASYDFRSSTRAEGPSEQYMQESEKPWTIGEESQAVLTSETAIAPEGEACMECRRETCETSVVKLQCTHVYCSSYCFARSLAGKYPPQCPQCGVKVDEDLVNYLKEVSTQFPHCLVCSKLINGHSEEIKTELPRVVCNGEVRHFCCSENCKGKLNGGKCPLCFTLPAPNQPNSHQLLPSGPRRRGRRSFIVRFLCCFTAED